MPKKRALMERRQQLKRARAARSRASSAAHPRVANADTSTSSRDLWIALGIVAVILVILGGLYMLSVAKPPASKDAKSWDTPPTMQIDTAKSYEAVLTTVKGVVRVELYDDLVPNTVNNFVFLARQGFYDGVTFHRVISGFMAQTGDPTGTGSGGPGYDFADEIVSTLRHDGPGVLSMANAGPNTNGSQFFITYAATPHLDGKHTVFGRVIEGLEVVQSLAPRDPRSAIKPGDQILTVEIIER
jgi:cyclophilin family peptidyl-prolyl cis-trans isomerase